MRLGLELVIGILAGTIPFLVLRAPLGRMLTDLCAGAQERAAFWARYTWLVFYLTPVLFAIVSGGQGGSDQPLSSAFLERTVQAALFGLLCAVVVVGLILVRIIRDQGPSA